jgi:leader peptidase (prepilin peptidase)/N-methyltransferase
MSMPALDLLLSLPGLALLGLMVGSFLNVVVHRLPRMLERQWWEDAAHQFGDAGSHERVFAQPAPAALGAQAQGVFERLRGLPAYDLIRPRSRCPACGHAIRWHENIPVLGWLRLRGRCSACGTRIPVRYPAVELLTGAVFALVGWRFGPTPAALLWCAVAAVLLALSFIDWDTTLLPDPLTQPLLWAGLVAAAAGWTGVPLATALVGAVAGYLSLWSVYWLFKLATGKEGMGYGDFKLLAAIGAWLGWQALLPVLLMASVIGAAVGLLMKATGALREGRYVPFGPFLAGGALVAIVAGTDAVLAAIGWR